MLYFSEKYPVSIQPGRQYQISFEVIIHTPCKLFADFYVYPGNIHKDIVDGDDITVSIPESGKYTAIVDSPKYDDLIPNAYLRLWNHTLPRSSIQVSNVHTESIGDYNDKDPLFDSELYTYKLDLNKIDLSLVSSWDCNCGIATYSKYLLNGLQKLDPSFKLQVVPVSNKVPVRVDSELTHIQHEWGIFPKMPEISGRCILTWHSVAAAKHIATTDLGKVIDTHIVHSPRAKTALSMSINYNKITVIPHGSYEFPEISKQAARELLGIPLNKFILFVFGMRADFKGYKDIYPINIDNLVILVSSGSNKKESQQLAAKFDREFKSTKYVKFMNKFLSELEVTLYSIASDAFLFNYNPSKSWISASGAFHRIVGAGRPIICTDVPQFDELEHQKNAFKIKSGSEIPQYIQKLMNDHQLVDQMGTSALQVALDTSWTKIAKMHKKIYESGAEK